MADPTQTHLSELMTKIEFFNQRQLATSMGATTDGYCHAMCLDWVRRSLQHHERGASLTFHFDEEPGSERTARVIGRQMEMQKQISAKKTDVTSRQNEMIQTSNALNQAALDAKNLAVYLAETLQMNSDVEAFSKSVLFPVGDRRNALNKIKQGLFAALPDEMSMAAWIALASKIKEWKVDWEDERDRLRSVAPNLARYDVLFKLSMPTLKSTLQSHRRLQENGPPSRRGFDGITIEHTCEAADFPTAMAHSVLHTVCVHLKPKQAAMIGFDIGATGHEVAVRLAPNGETFMFIDPNYGIFRGSKAQLSNAFDFLFDQQTGVYNNVEAPDGGAIKGTFDFTVFKRMDA